MEAIQSAKFIGGIAEVRITPTSNVNLSVDDANSVEVLFRDPLLIETIELLEDRSSYSEVEIVEDGVSLVRHSLKLVLKRELGLRLRATLSTRYMDGVVAIVTIHARERLLVGFTSKFGIEQPLRVIGGAFETGSSPKDYPLFSLTLQCEDTSYATKFE